MSAIGNNNNQSYWEPKINVELGSLTRLAIPGPRCEGHPSGGMGDATQLMTLPYNGVHAFLF